MSLLAASTPSYWLALMLMLVFSVALGWLPAIGVGTPAHYVLPCLALGLQSAGAVARMTRASVRDVLAQDFLRAARAKGVPERRVLLRHGLRNALLPVLSLVGLRIGGLLAGTVLVESVFAVPGVGRMMVDAVVARDFPMVQGGVLVVAAMVVVVNALTDLVAALARSAGARVTAWLAFFRRDLLAGAGRRCSLVAVRRRGSARAVAGAVRSAGRRPGGELPAELVRRIRSAPTISAATP